MKNQIQLRKLHMRLVEGSEIDLTVPKGTVIGITGDTGCGKSELLRYIAGIRRPAEMGEVLVNGLDPYSHLDERKLRREVAYVPQTPGEADVCATVALDLASGPENAGWEPARTRYAVKKWLKDYDLPGGKTRMAILSSGAKIRTILAGLLITEPEIILMDDIFALMNAGEAYTLFRSILHHAKKREQTVIFVSGRQEELRLADGIYELSGGHLYDSTERIMHAADLGIGIKQAGQDASEEESTNVDADPAAEIGGKNRNEEQKMKISCTGVYKRGVNPFLLVSHWRPYPGSRSMSFSFRESGSYRITGGTGTGKTELLYLLSGRMPAAEGGLYHDNETIFLRKELIRISGLSSADPAADFIRDTVLEDVYSGCPAGMSKDEKLEMAGGMLDRLGFQEKLLKKNPGKLSFGEKKIVSLAGALIRQGGLLAADCPMAGLDADKRKKLKAVIAEQRKNGMCFVFTDPDSIC